MELTAAVPRISTQPSELSTITADEVGEIDRTQIVESQTLLDELEAGNQARPAPRYFLRLWPKLSVSGLRLFALCVLSSSRASTNRATSVQTMRPSELKTQ
jgi:hypothetical protein